MWDMIMGFDFLDVAHAGVLPHRRTLLLEEADRLRWLSTSMKPQASPWEPAERDVLAQAVRSVSTRSPTANIEDEYVLCRIARALAPWILLILLFGGFFLEAIVVRRLWRVGSLHCKTHRKVYSGFSTVFLLLLLLAVGIGFPAAWLRR